nr:12317_t:CDS:2 [Entrophospora candida]
MYPRCAVDELVIILLANTNKSKTTEYESISIYDQSCKSSSSVLQTIFRPDSFVTEGECLPDVKSPTSVCKLFSVKIDNIILSIIGGLCCYSTSAELKQVPNLYLLNITASHVNSKKYNNKYIAKFGLPQGYLAQGDPSSPISYVHCLRNANAEPVYECESIDNDFFFVQLLVQFPKVELPVVNIYIFGDKCEQRTVCGDLASSSENQDSDKISLGPFGTWPKYAIIIGGCILGLGLVGALYLVYRRNVGEGGGFYKKNEKKDSVSSPNLFLDSESKIKQLESYINEDEVVRNTKAVLPRSSLEFDNKDIYIHEFVPASSSVVIEVDKDSSLSSSNNNSHHNHNNHHSSHSNRFSKRHSNKLSTDDNQNLNPEVSFSIPTRSRDTRGNGSGSDHHDGRGSLSASSSNSQSKREPFSESRTTEQSISGRQHLKIDGRKIDSDSEGSSSSSDVPLGDKIPLAILAIRSLSKKSLSNQSARSQSKNGKNVAVEEDEEDKPLGQTISSSKEKNLDGEDSIVGDFLGSVLSEALAGYSDSGRVSSNDINIGGDEEEDKGKTTKEQIIERHRSTSCQHRDRPLLEIKRKGRPITQCNNCRELRKTQNLHIKCNCNERKKEVTPSLSQSKSSVIITSSNDSSESPTNFDNFVSNLSSSDKLKVQSLLNPCKCLTGDKCICCRDEENEFISSTENSNRDCNTMEGSDEKSGDLSGVLGAGICSSTPDDLVNIIYSSFKSIPSANKSGSCCGSSSKPICRCGSGCKCKGCDTHALRVDLNPQVQPVLSKLKTSCCAAPHIPKPKHTVIIDEDGVLLCGCGCKKPNSECSGLR